MRLNEARSSPCWTFFNSVVAQNNQFGPFKEDGPDLLLEADLSRSLEDLYAFLHEVRTAGEALTTFATTSSIISSCRDHWHQSCASLQSSTAPSAASSVEEHNHRDLKSHLRAARSYCISLTLGLIMETIVRIYHPSHEHVLAGTSQKLTGELVLLAKQATLYKPLGGTFLDPFLNTAWGLGDWRSRAHLVSALETHQIEFDVKRATILSKRLSILLDTVRSRIAAQSPRHTSDSASPPGYPCLGHADLHSRLSSSESTGAVRHLRLGAWIGSS